MQQFLHTESASGLVLAAAAAAALLWANLHASSYADLWAPGSTSGVGDWSAHDPAEAR
ncbi:MAG: Na+/H+ antiporter NhaA [Thermoleophilia bacterium]